MTKKDIQKTRPMFSNRLRKDVIIAIKIASVEEQRHEYELVEDAIDMYIAKKHPRIKAMVSSDGKSNK